MDPRFEKMSDWLRNDLKLKISHITPASADASFRRYFRVRIVPPDSPPERVDNATFIVMDAPPDKEDCAPFIRIANALHTMGLNVPRIEQQNLTDGFLLLSDLGEDSYLSFLDHNTASQLYRDAIDALVTMQQAGQSHAITLASYDNALLMCEMTLFSDWLLARHLDLQLSDSERSILAVAFDLLADNALSQPQVWVHRDYHCRNLMVCHNNSGPNPGILDFQDAVLGPMTYDLVSLLRDCYIEWPQAQQQQWRDYYCQRAEEHGLLVASQRDQFTRWFDLMGVQRHLKAAGIFARLYQRDGKTDYMNDVPRTLSYICRLSETYSELGGLIDLIEKRVLPLLSKDPLNNGL